MRVLGTTGILPVRKRVLTDIPLWQDASDTHTQSPIPTTKRQKHHSVATKSLLSPPPTTQTYANDNSHNPIGNQHFRQRHKSEAKKKVHYVARNAIRDKSPPSLR